LRDGNLREQIPVLRLLGGGSENVSTGTQTEVVMPQMGVSVSEGTVTKWLKQQGEPVALDEPLLEISTDKVDTEVPSPGEGIVTAILVQEGTTVEVGTVLALISPAGAVDMSANEPAEPAPELPTVFSPPSEPPTAVVSSSSAQPQAAHPDGDGRTFVSPVVARIAAEHGVDPSVVPGTGQGGRVTKKDMLAFVESGAVAPAPTKASEAPPTAQVVSPPEPPAPPAAPATPAPPEPVGRPSSPQPQAADLEDDLAPGESAAPITACVAA
jgi:2-oxoglutarate dehydrogenase E2 component (dihydrolipoamide succinyltransferase)